MKIEEIEFIYVTIVIVKIRHINTCSETCCLIKIIFRNDKFRSKKQNYMPVKMVLKSSLTVTLPITDIFQKNIETLTEKKYNSYNHV